MKAITKTRQEIELRELSPTDFGKLSSYLSLLSPETKKRFGPHAYDLNSILDFYKQHENRAFIALNTKDEIIGYAIMRTGFLDHDSKRLSNYGLELSKEHDSTFAPSVADAYQSQGVGQLVFEYILQVIETLPIKRIILWGGVQKENEKAVNFYRKKGFKAIGEFEYHGWNIDMVLELPPRANEQY